MLRWIVSLFTPAPAPKPVEIPATYRNPYTPPRVMGRTGPRGGY